jgi:two-component system chemotaxis sensor kinase CheA
VTEFRDQFISAYFVECEEHLTSIRRGLLALEGSVGQSRPDPEITEELFRSYHSLKGLAGMVEDRDGELLSHEMEGYLRAIREGEVALTTHGIEMLIEGTAALERAIIARRDASESHDSTASLAHLRALLADAATPVPADPARQGASPGRVPDWECLFVPSAELIARGINVNAIRERLREAGSILSATPTVTEEGVAFRFLFAGAIDDATAAAWRTDGIVCARVTEAAAPAQVAGPAEAASASGAMPNHYVRVDLARLDELMHLIGELVMLRARLNETHALVERHVPSAHWRAIQESTTAIDRQLRALREGVMRVRLVPVGEIFRRMPFVVRDLARETGQRVTVELSGQETEMDKFLVERMMDPVLHLVRNAIGHGIESTEERVAAGKPPIATIRLHGSAAGDIVAIEVSDDGRGIDVAAVIRRARQMELPVPDEDDVAALFDVICFPGFSTREESDRLSGRGFGMAVVRSRVQELGGSLRMESLRGVGTRFIITLPLTLAIIEALIARVGAQTFALPQAAVREVIEVCAQAIQQIEGHEVTEYRGAALPVVRLSDVLGITVIPRPRLHAFVLGEGPAAIGLVVDQIVGQREIVVRATADPLIHVDGITGATDLGDGRAVLILDAAAVSRRVPLRAIA